MIMRLSREQVTPKEEPEERINYNELLNVMNELQNDAASLTLTVLDQQYIKDFYNELKSSPNFYDSDWEEWARTIKQINQDFEFDSFSATEFYDLKDSTLETVRITNKHHNLNIILYNVGGIRGKGRNSNIKVEITDTHGITMAQWDEYIKTRKVA